jgi:sec-independent protein translocase protein TatB
MFGIDSPELLVILVVALVVIGPKELPALLKTWGKWMATMRGMASEFRGHVDEMVRQSELDQVKKTLESSTGGLDFKSLDPTKEMRSIIQEGLSEGEKALADAKTSLDNPPLDNPLAEPESAPQIGVDPAPESLAAAPEALAEVVHPAEPEVAHPTEPEAAVPPETPSDPSHEGKPHEDKPQAAAAG